MNERRIPNINRSGDPHLVEGGDLPDFSKKMTREEALLRVKDIGEDIDNRNLHSGEMEYEELMTEIGKLKKIL